MIRNKPLKTFHCTQRRGTRYNGGVRGKGDFPKENADPAKGKRKPRGEAARLERGEGFPRLPIAFT
jgi:hypothetical protein